MVRFYIVRHGQTLLNSLDRAQGWADPPLTGAGKQMAAAIYEHDTTGMAEPFQTIESRLKSVFADAVQKDGMQENTDILIVTHAFAIKTIFHLFAPEQLSGLGKVKNASVSRLIFENGIFSLEPDIQL